MSRGLSEVSVRAADEVAVEPSDAVDVPRVLGARNRRQGGWVLLDYVDFVVHVFLAERRAFYDIERLRKSARPLTPAEFDAELKEDLAAKTRAARSNSKTAANRADSTPTQKPVSTKAAKTVAPAKKTAAKKAPASKPAPAKKSSPKKAAAKKAAAPRRTSR